MLNKWPNASGGVNHFKNRRIWEVILQHNHDRQSYRHEQRAAIGTTYITPNRKLSGALFGKRNAIGPYHDSCCVAARRPTRVQCSP